MRERPSAIDSGGTDPPASAPSGPCCSPFAPGPCATPPRSPPLGCNLVSSSSPSAPPEGISAPEDDVASHSTPSPSKSSSQDAPPPPRDPPPLAMERPTQWGMRWGQSPPAGRPALAAATPGASRTGPCWMKSSDGANANCCRCSSAPRRNRVARKEGRPEKGANASPAPVAWCVSCMLPANGVCTGMETCDEECVRCKVRQSKVKNATREGAGRSPRTGRIPGRSADFVKKKQIVFDQPCWARAGLGRCIERSRKDCAVAIRSAWDQPRMLIAGIRHLLSML